MNDAKHLGLGVLIRQLFGDTRTVEAIKHAVGQRIVSASVADNELRIQLADKSTMVLKDEGQSCCENRYMETDDDLMGYADATIIGFDLLDAPNGDSEYGEHEVQFLAVTTDRGIFKIHTHNIHNGYYGGFSIEASISPKDDQ